MPVDGLSPQLLHPAGRCANQRPGAPSCKVTLDHESQPNPMSLLSPLANARRKKKPPRSARPADTCASGDAFALAQLEPGVPASPTTTARVAEPMLPALSVAR